MENGICGATFCESAALRRGLVGYFSWLALSVKSFGFARFPLLSLTRHLPPARGKSFLKVGALGSPRRLHLFAKASPLGRGGFAQQRRRGRGCCPCAMCLFPSPLLQFVQLRQLFVKKFHLRGGENRRRERGRAAFESKEFFIGNTEKSSCKLTTKGV